VKALDVFNGNDGDVTKAYYAALRAKGFFGELALTLFRAQKRSTAAKRYRGGRYRHAAYDVKNWSLSEICRLLTQVDHGYAWGWGRDPKTPGFEWVLYVELPTGQVSFHSAERLGGPDYPRKWDGQKLSAERIIAFCDAVHSCTDTLQSGHIMKVDRETELPASSPSQLCECASLMYRNNDDGSRDYKVQGKPTCRRCLARGWCAICPACSGAGMAEGGRAVCMKCGGSGYVPASAAVGVIL
jgi:hypothetical protein